MKEKCCDCTNGNIFIVDSGLTSYRPCPCHCHKEKPMNDKELDLGDYKKFISSAKTSHPDWPGNIHARFWGLIREVDRLLKVGNRDWNKLGELVSQKSKLEKENSKLREKIKEYRECHVHTTGCPEGGHNND